MTTTSTRLRYRAELAPILGSTFQPTGFPDIGAATFDRWSDGATVPALLVESVQSMANRLEATAWNDATREPVDDVSGLPWVRVVRDAGDFLTSSRLEAHRLASAWVRDAKLGDEHMEKVIGDRLGLRADTPLDYPAMARAVAALDPFCLLHGVFFSQKAWLGQPKFPRAVSSVIEATDVRRAVSGGRKADLVRHSLDSESGGTAEGYGSVPFHRVEWTARSITASFVIDAELLRSYGLPSGATDALIALAQWEVRRLLTGGLRLRTACDFEVIDEPADLPAEDDLEAMIRTGVAAAEDVFGDGGAIAVEWTSDKKKR